MSLLASSMAYAYNNGAEWVNEYHGYASNLANNDDNANGFNNELGSDADWDTSFTFGDDSAWEDDFKDPSKGGDDSSYADNVEFAFFSGHGSPSGFYFGSTVDDHELNYNDALWGNSRLDWIAIDACQVLQQSGITNWMGGFEGLHSMVGFDTVASDVTNRGSLFAQRMDGTLATWTVVQAWFQAGADTEGSSAYVAALAADADGSESTYDCWNDYIYGHGSQVNPPADPQFYWYARYQC